MSPGVKIVLTIASLLAATGVPSVTSVDPSARVRGDLVVGALFSVHHAPRGGKGALTCGTIRETYGIQRVETALITLDKINRESSILPGVTLGLEARDSCWSAPVSLQQSIELVRDAITPVLTLSPNGESATCQDASSIQTEPPVTTKAPVVGVVGPGSSSAALQVQNLLQLFSIPQIGYSPTSRDLSDKTRYSTFLRVVPSDYYQAQLLVDLVQYFNWTYVSIVNTDENYGQSGMQAFRELAEKNGVCVAREDAVLSTAEDLVFDRVLMNLDQDPHANVVVCFCEGMTMRGLLAATKRLNLTGRFLFIGSDGWADRDDVVEDLESEAWGSLSIRIYSPYINEFDDHYFALNPFNNSRNPWFVEFWQHKFNCVMPNTVVAGVGDEAAAAGTPQFEDENNSREVAAITSSSDSAPDTRRICNGTEKLSDRYKQDPKMSFVMKSFWAMAHGLHSMLEETCGRGYYGVCKEMYPFNGTLFKNHLMNISFGFGEEEVEFDRRGDPPGRYEILNFQLMSNGSYGYVQIGDWNNGTLVFSASPQARKEDLVTSVCSKPCAPGQYKNSKWSGGQEKKCCWACVNCLHNQIVNSEQTACDACPSGQYPNSNKTKCQIIPEEYISWGDAEAVVAMCFSAMGLVATFVTCHIFIRHNDTPVVKASTRELSYLILAGMTLAHIAVFPILAKPTRITCALSRLMPGISFAMMYASLFTKTNRIARILAGSKKRFPKRKPMFMSATAQVVITCFLIMLEAGVAAAMLVIEPPMARAEYPAHDRAVLTCATSPRAVLSPLAFDGLLVALCTLYAVKTRNVPENFNEAKFIGFAMYTTCVIWIAFGPIYFGSESKVVTMCMCVTLSASVTLVFLFLPKLYIIVLRPERNNRALFTTSKSIRCHIGARVAAAIAEPPAKQAIYRLATGDSDIAGRRRSVSRRTLSVQTGAELLGDLSKSHNDRSTSPMVRPLLATHRCPSSPSCNWQDQPCRYDGRIISKSSDNVTLSSNNYCAAPETTSHVRRSNAKLCSGAKSLGSCLSLLVGRSDATLKTIERFPDTTTIAEWLELDAELLMCHSRNDHCSKTQSNDSITGYGSPPPTRQSRVENETTPYEERAGANFRERKSRIREERAGETCSNGEPVINITITLGTEMPDFHQLAPQSTV